MSEKAMGDSVGAVVVDIGCLYSKIGFAGDDGPSQYVNSCLGEGGKLVDSLYDGPVRHPLNDDTGNVRVDKTLLEALLTQTLEQNLRTDPKDRPVMITEPYTCDAASRMALCDSLFQTFECSAGFIARKSTLALISVGRGNGLCTHLSHKGCTVAPVIDGFVLERNQQTFNLGGMALDEELRKSLGYSTPLSFRMQQHLRSAREAVGRIVGKTTVKDWKSLCEASADNAAASQYEMPDGTVVSAADVASIQVPDCIFKPADVASPGLISCVASVVQQTDPDIRRALMQGAAMLGGLTLTRGFAGRVMDDWAADSFLGSQKYKLIMPSGTHERRFATWIGGSILGSLHTFGQMWICAEEYEETGSSIAIRKCV
ncbi:MAG: uncharacterized protein KVP18_001844 [Porospora cf. gigantea A]|uniref:uncharacterized protein n=1 Tax=Porospora cf. gigantea A TaxID=2853593 RepID=UPI00355A651C|nr:MAG: hypothetical protein KVP18_001844 [Porospora cf. gigantea A]